MYRVILVDDEMLIRVVYKSAINWEQNGFQIVGEYENGKQALQAYDEVKPDIVLTDIKMPVCNGIELIAELKKKNPSPICIILSAYDDFEYVKEGLKLGAEDYILKLDMTPDKLIGVLKRVTSKIDKLRDETVFYKTSQWNESRKKFLIEWIRGEHTDSDNIKRHLDFYNIDFPKGHLLCLGIHFIDVPDYYKDSQERMIWNTAINLLDDTLGSVGMCVNIPLPPDRCCSIISVSDTKDDGKAYTDNIIKIVRNSFASIMNITDLKVDCAFASCLEQVPETFAAIERNKDIEDTGKSSVIFNNELLKLKNDFTTGKYDDALETIKTIEKKMSNKIFFNKASYDKVCGIILFLIKSVMEQNDKLASLIQPEFDKRKISLKSCHSFLDYVKWIEETKNILQAALQEYRSTSSIVIKIKQYIEENYKQELKLVQLADHLMLSASHVSRVFSNEMGYSITEYLMQVRMRYARKMLIGTEKKINEIAREVGYDDSHYFSKVFKRINGCSPLEFRKKTK